MWSVTVWVSDQSFLVRRVNGNGDEVGSRPGTCERDLARSSRVTRAHAARHTADPARVHAHAARRAPVLLLATFSRLDVPRVKE